MTDQPKTTGTSPSWLDEWQATRNAEAVAARLEAGATVYVPATYWVAATGERSYGPLSFVVSAMHKLPSVMNLDRLHRRVLELMGQKPL